MAPAAKISFKSSMETGSGLYFRMLRRVSRASIVSMVCALFLRGTFAAFFRHSSARTIAAQAGTDVPPSGSLRARASAARRAPWGRRAPPPAASSAKRRRWPPPGRTAPPERRPSSPAAPPGGRAPPGCGRDRSPWQHSAPPPRGHTARRPDSPAPPASRPPPRRPPGRRGAFSRFRGRAVSFSTSSFRERGRADSSSTAFSRTWAAGGLSQGGQLRPAQLLSGAQAEGHHLTLPQAEDGSVLQVAEPAALHPAGGGQLTNPHPRSPRRRYPPRGRRRGRRPGPGCS